MVTQPCPGKVRFLPGADRLRLVYYVKTYGQTVVLAHWTMPWVRVIFSFGAEGDVSALVRCGLIFVVSDEIKTRDDDLMATLT